MIKSTHQPYFNENRLRNVATVVINSLWKLEYLPYDKVQAIRELIKTDPQEAVKKLCTELVSIANNTRKEGA